MTSLEIAELTGKQHKNLMQAIRNMEPAWEKHVDANLHWHRKGQRGKFCARWINDGGNPPCHRFGNSLRELFPSVVTQTLTRQLNNRLHFQLVEYKERKRRLKFQLTRAQFSALVDRRQTIIAVVIADENDHSARLCRFLALRSFSRYAL